VLPGGEGEGGPDVLAVDDERPGADDVDRVPGAEPFVGELDRVGGKDRGVDRRGGLQEPRRRVGEVEPHRVLVDHFRGFVIVHRFGNDERAARVALPVEVEVRRYHLRGERGAVRERHVLAQGEGEFGRVVIHLPLRGEPRLEVEGLRILVDSRSPILLMIPPFWYLPPSGGYNVVCASNSR